MGQLHRLRIWEDPAIRDALAWYLEVAENGRPAKFRIAATVPTHLDPATASEEALWAELDQLTRVFLMRWKPFARARLCPNPQTAQACWSSAASLLTACSRIAISVLGIAESTDGARGQGGITSDNIQLSEPTFGVFSRRTISFC